MVRRAWRVFVASVAGTVLAGAGCSVLFPFDDITGATAAPDASDEPIAIVPDVASDGTPSRCVNAYPPLPPDAAVSGGDIDFTIAIHWLDYGDRIGPDRAPTVS